MFLNGIDSFTYRVEMWKLEIHGVNSEYTSSNDSFIILFILKDCAFTFISGIVKFCMHESNWIKKSRNDWQSICINWQIGIV